MRAIAQAVNRSEKVEQLLDETEQQIAEAREDFVSIVADCPKLMLLSSRNIQEI